MATAQRCVCSLHSRAGGHCASSAAVCDGCYTAQRDCAPWIRRGDSHRTQVTRPQPLQCASLSSSSAVVSSGSPVWCSSSVAHLCVVPQWLTCVVFLSSGSLVWCSSVAHLRLTGSIRRFRPRSRWLADQHGGAMLLCSNSPNNTIVSCSDAPQCSRRTHLLCCDATLTALH